MHEDTKDGGNDDDDKDDYYDDDDNDDDDDDENENDSDDDDNDLCKTMHEWAQSRWHSSLSICACTDALRLPDDVDHDVDYDHYDDHYDDSDDDDDFDDGNGNLIRRSVAFSHHSKFPFLLEDNLPSNLFYDCNYHYH